jgi:hypothetical protein
MKQFLKKWRAGTLLTLFGCTATWALLVAPGTGSGSLVGIQVHTRIWVGPIVGNWNADGDQSGADLGAFWSFPEPAGTTQATSKPNKGVRLCMDLVRPRLADGRQAISENRPLFQVQLTPHCKPLITE